MDKSGYFVASLPQNCTTRDLKIFFSEYGKVYHAALGKRPNGEQLNYGWVHFRRPQPDLLERGPFIMGGKKIVVEHLDPNAGSGGERRGPSSQHPHQQQRHYNDQHDHYHQQLRQPPRNSDAYGERREYELHTSSRNKERYGEERGYTNTRKRRSRSPDDQTESRDATGRRSREEKRPESPPVSAAPPPPQPTVLPSSLPTAVADNSDKFICIPFSLCPPQVYSTDPRILIARLDNTRLGALSIIGPALTMTRVPTATSSVPPPPGPPPPSSR